MKNRSQDDGVGSVRPRMSWAVFALAIMSLAAVAHAPKMELISHW
jgi:hypothetical protein